jgi:signal transduction histidine kinase
MEKTYQAAPHLPDIHSGRQQFDMIELINKFRKWYEHSLVERNLQLTTKIGSDIPRYVLGNQLIVKHIFFEPGKNSLLYLGPGEVFLEINSKKLAGRRYAIYQTITFSGNGIPCDKEKELFQPTRFSDRDGFRLRSTNLYYARMIAGILGGDIRIENRLGFGTRYQVEIRLLSATA